MTELRRWILVLMLIGLAVTPIDIVAVECSQRRGAGATPTTAPNDDSR